MRCLLGGVGGAQGAGSDRTRSLTDAAPSLRPLRSVPIVIGLEMTTGATLNHGHR